MRGVSMKPPRRGHRPRPTVRGAIAGVIVVVGAAIAAWWIFSESSTDNQAQISNRKSLIKEVSPSVAPKEQVAEKKKDPHEGMYKTPGGAWYPIGEPSLPFYTRRHPVVTNYGYRAKGPSVAKTTTEKALLALFSRRLGEMPPVLPRMSEQQRKDLMGVLISKNPPSDEDSEKTRLNKETLQKAKEAMCAYISEGGDPQTFFDHYRGELKNAFDARIQAQRMVSAAIKDGEDPAVVDELAEKLNKHLADKGIMPIHHIKRSAE